jgi:hypothetical protein
VEQAVKALMLILQAGNFGCVVLDVADAPGEAIRRLPFTTWLRLQRVLEGSQTACLLVGTEPMARSSAGLSVKLERAKGKEQRAEGYGQMFKGLDVNLHVRSAKGHLREGVRASLATQVSPYV